MKKRITVLSVCLSLLCALCGACSSNTETAAPLAPANEIVLSAFEDYYDLQKIQWNSIIGKISLNDDANYVRQGAKSAKLYMDYTSDVPVDYNDNDGGKAFSDCYRPQIIFGTYLYNAAVGNTDNLGSFNLCVFNANDRPVDLGFAVRDDGKKIAFSDGCTLAPNRWNDVCFDIKSYFYPTGMGISEFILYIYDDERDTAEDLTLYFDNCFVRTAAKTAAPAVAQAEKEILSFGSMKDLTHCLATTESATYPAAYLSYTDREVFEGQSGALKATLRAGNNWEYDVTLKNNGYKIEILGETVAARTQNASGIAVDCKNESSGDLYARITAQSATKKVESKTLLRAGATQTVELNDLTGLEGEPIEKLTVWFDNWNLVGTYNVYLRNLRTK